MNDIISYRQYCEGVMIVLSSDLNWAEENRIRAIAQPLYEEIDRAFATLSSLKLSRTQERDLYDSLMLISHSANTINTQPFRVNKTGDLPLLESTIRTFVSTLQEQLHQIVLKFPVPTVAD